MWSRYVHISFVRLAIWCLSLSILVLITTALVGCNRTEPSAPAERFVEVSETIVLETDSTEWRVCLFATGKTYAEAMQVTLQKPWNLPTKEDAHVLRLLDYPHDERFVTSDGYTFSMPSVSVTKAGSKTKYSVLGLWVRPTTIDVPF